MIELALARNGSVFPQDGQEARPLRLSFVNRRSVYRRLRSPGEIRFTVVEREPGGVLHHPAEGGRHELHEL